MASSNPDYYDNEQNVHKWQDILGKSIMKIWDNKWHFGNV